MYVCTYTYTRMYIYIRCAIGRYVYRYREKVYGGIWCAPLSRYVNDADIIQVRTYMGRPGFSAADVCFTIRYGRAQAPAERSLRFCRKFADSPSPPSSLSGFLIAFLFFLTGDGGQREVECTKGKKEVRVSSAGSRYRHLVPYKRLESD